MKLILSLLLIVYASANHQVDETWRYDLTAEEEKVDIPTSGLYVAIIEVANCPDRNLTFEIKSSQAAVNGTCRPLYQLCSSSLQFKEAGQMTIRMDPQRSATCLFSVQVKYAYALTSRIDMAITPGVLYYLTLPIRSSRAKFSFGCERFSMLVWRNGVHGNPYAMENLYNDEACGMRVNLTSEQLLFMVRPQSQLETVKGSISVLESFVKAEIGSDIRLGTGTTFLYVSEFLPSEDDHLMITVNSTEGVRFWVDFLTIEETQFPTSWSNAMSSEVNGREHPFMFIKIGKVSRRKAQVGVRITVTVPNYLIDRNIFLSLKLGSAFYATNLRKWSWRGYNCLNEPGMKAVGSHCVACPLGCAKCGSNTCEACLPERYNFLEKSCPKYDQVHFKSYVQCDSLWADNRIGRSGGYTICEVGGELTAIANMLSAFGIEGMNPGKLNTRLVAAGAFTSTSFSYQILEKLFGVRFRMSAEGNADSMEVFATHDNDWVLQTAVHQNGTIYGVSSRHGLRRTWTASDKLRIFRFQKLQGTTIPE